MNKDRKVKPNVCYIVVRPIHVEGSTQNGAFYREVTLPRVPIVTDHYVLNRHAHPKSAFVDQVELGPTDLDPSHVFLRPMRGEDFDKVIARTHEGWQPYNG